MRKVELRSDDMKITKKNLADIWEDMKWDEKSSDKMRWDEVQAWRVECGVWRVQCEVWGKCLLGVALHRGRAQVMFSDNNTATASHKARTHGPGWRTAHASSLVVVLGSDSWKLRYEKRRDEKRWAGIRWEELRWDEVRSVKSAVWSVGREECSVKSEECSVKSEVWSVECECEEWSVECEESSEKCEVWTVKCEVWSAKSAVWSVKCGVWSVKCGVWRVQWEVRSAKWSFKCDMWNRTPLSQNARTHGLGWRTAHASSIDEKGLIYP